MKYKAKVEVKVFLDTDRCEFCGSIQGGYINKNIDRYINIRNGHKCTHCGVAEKPL